MHRKPNPQDFEILEAAMPLLPQALQILLKYLLYILQMLQEQLFYGTQAMDVHLAGRIPKYFPKVVLK